MGQRTVLSVFTDNYFNPEDIPLGGLVLNKRAPTEDFMALPGTVKLSPSDIRASPFEGVRVISKNDRGCKFKFAATKILTFHHDHSNAPIIDVTAKKATSYFLQNSGNIFDSIKNDLESKKWIEERMHLSKIYMIVGVQTVFDAKVTQDEDRKSTTGGGLQISMEQLLTLASLSEQQLLDIKFNGGFKDNQSTLVEFVAPGERIVGIQYRRLGFRLFHSTSLANAALKEGKWWYRLGDAGTRGNEQGDAVEVYFEDFNKVDIEKEHDDEEHDDEEDDTHGDWEVQDVGEVEGREVVAIFSERT